MNPDNNDVQKLSSDARARLILDMFHRIVVHYALWFTEIRHQMGIGKALDTLQVVFQKSYQTQINRLSKILDFPMVDDIPEYLLTMPKETQIKLMKGIANNWVANDGIWFQEVEFTNGMVDAKRCNDTCWAHFSPFEARSIKHCLKISDMPGLAGLKTALKFRLYAMNNPFSIVDEGPNSFLYYMNACQVQAARKRKGLDDYPCNSAGIVEYSYFAATIDPRITTTCISCPPDEHPDDWYCAWRFDLSKSRHKPTD